MTKPGDESYNIEKYDKDQDGKEKRADEIKDTKAVDKQTDLNATNKINYSNDHHCHQRITTTIHVR